MKKSKTKPTLPIPNPYGEDEYGVPSDLRNLLDEQKRSVREEDEDMNSTDSLNDMLEDYYE